MTLIRLSLTDFRNHAGVDLGAGPGLVALHGDNGAGKTNIVEAISLLAPGRGLRRAPLAEMVRDGASGGFAVFAEVLAGEGLAPVALGTGIEPAHPGRRLVRINGSPAATTALGDRSEEHTSELQSPMRISYAVFCLKKKKKTEKEKAQTPVTYAHTVVR